MSGSLTKPAVPPGPDQRFPKQERILRRPHYLRVQTQGRKVHTRHFVILVLPSDQRRLGVTCGKRVGRAHQRNRVKRLVREVFRRNKAFFPADCDVVLVARPGAERLDYQAVKDELERAASALSRLDRSAKMERLRDDPR